MPSKTTLRRAKRDARQGKKPTTQAGEFIREEMHALHHGSPHVHSRKQAIAIGLSEARRAGVKLAAPKKKSADVQRRAARDRAIGQGTARPSPSRSRGAREAARTRERRAGA